MRRVVRFSGRAVIIIVLTLLLLEIVVRAVWGNTNTITLFDRELSLLPLPLVSDKHLQILENWEQNPTPYLQFDPVLGWSIRPNAFAQNEGHAYTSNSIGIRSLREYALEKNPGLIRVVAFGPSFTHGDEVSDEAAWPAQMEQARPDLEVMNWGVGGYGIDQAFLRYKTAGQAYQPDIVLIGFEENNIHRNVNRFRPFLSYATNLPLTKPVFIQGETTLRLLENPFKDFQAFKETLRYRPHRFLDIICPHDFYCRRARYQLSPFDTFKSFRFLRTLAYEIGNSKGPDLSSMGGPGENGAWALDEVQRINWRLIRMFLEEASQNGSIPVVVAFPERSTIEAYEQGYGQATFYNTGVRFLRQQDVQVIDLPPVFLRHKTANDLAYADYYAADGGHFNHLGNYIVGQTVLTYLVQQGILPNEES